MVIVIILSISDKYAYYEIEHENMFIPMKTYFQKYSTITILYLQINLHEDDLVNLSWKQFLAV